MELAPLAVTSKLPHPRHTGHKILQMGLLLRRVPACSDSGGRNTLHLLLSAKIFGAIAVDGYIGMLRYYEDPRQLVRLRTILAMFNIISRVTLL